MKELASTFERVAEGDVRAHITALKELSLLLQKNDPRAELQLMLELTKRNSEPVLRAFDNCMGVLTATPLAVGTTPSQGWTALALSTVYRRPAQSKLAKVSNSEALAKMLAEQSGLDPLDVYVWPVTVNARDAYSMPPAAVYSFAQKLKALFELTGGHPMYRLALEAFSHELPWASPTQVVNKGLAGAPNVEYDEAIFLVMLRCKPGARAQRENQKKVQKLADTALKYEATYELDSGEVVRTLHESISCDTWWSAFRSTLHIAQAFGSFVFAQVLCEQKGYARKDLQFCLTRVEEMDGISYSSRVSVIHRRDGLQVGHLCWNLAEHDQFANALRHILAAGSVTDFRNITTAYASVEADRPGEVPRFFVPQRGWESPGTLYVSGRRG